MAFNFIQSTPVQPQPTSSLPSSEGWQRLEKDGPDKTPEKKPSLLLRFLNKLWGPIPWLLEASLIIDIILRRPADALLTGLLVLTNAALGVIFVNPKGETRMAQATGRLDRLILDFCKDVIMLNCALAISVLAGVLVRKMPFADMLPFVLILIAASVPAELPAFLAQIASLGAKSMAEKGVYVAGANAIEETAGMQVLFVEKTGTLTEDQLSVAVVKSYSPYTEDDVLRLAAMASTETTRDPIDLAILERAKAAGVLPDYGQQISYLPFNQMVKRWEATFGTDGEAIRIMKGFPNVLFDLSGGSNSLEREANRFSLAGYQVIAVAVGDESHMQIAGLVALQDPLRTDSKTKIELLRELGIRVVMITNDDVRTAQAVAREAGLGGAAYPAQALHNQAHLQRSGCIVDDCTSYAEMLPEDKVRLAEIYHSTDCRIGMTGSVEKDIPSLRQADIGIATAQATDGARAAAGLILSNTGISGIADAVLASRQVYQQILGNSLYLLVMSLVTGLFLSLHFVLAGTAVMTPLSIILLLIAGSPTTAALAMDKGSISRHPLRANRQAFAASALCLAAPLLLFSFLVLWVGENLLHLPLPGLQTLIFANLVFYSQGMIYLLRERGRAWDSSPDKRMLISSLVVILAVCLIVTLGILVTPVSPAIVLALLGATLLFLLAVDYLKVNLFRWLEGRG